MSTSGSINFSVTRSDVIDHALRLISVIGEQESPSANDTSVATRALNMMVKSWQAQGLHLWLESEATGILTADIPTYEISSTAGRVAEILVETSISADEASAQTILSVTDTSNIAANDKIGILQDDGTVHWTTVASTTSTTVTVDDALTDDAAAGNRVYAYTYSLSRPIDISHVRLRNDDDYDTELRRVSRKEYFAIPNKYQSGTPLVWYYDPQLSAGIIKVWPCPDTAKMRLKLTFQRTIEDFDSGTDNPDLPTEWAEALTYGLAMRLASIYDREDKLQVIAPMASQLLEGLKDWDNEKTSLFIHPDTGHNF